MLLVLAPWLAFGAELSISPDPVTDCVAGAGRATLRWSGASAGVDVRVGDAAGPSMTGPTGGSGEATTGHWVNEGLRFLLVNPQGAVEASVTARLRCGGAPSVLDPVFRTGSWLPLQVGNTWIYRQNTRQVTSAYSTRTIARTEELGGRTYFVLTADNLTPTRLREDPEGRIWRFTGTASSPREEILLDPAKAVRAPVIHALGNFPEAASQNVSTGLELDSQVYARGIGLVRSQARLMTGSSGGFTDNLELVEVRLDGVRLALPSPQLSLSVESTVLDVTGKRVTNCVIPSYCIACVSDLPGTYKPCAQARVDVRASAPYALDLELLDSAGQAVYRAPTVNGAGELLRYIQLPLYARPNEPFAPGAYTLVARLRSGTEVRATSSLIVRID